MCLLLALVPVALFPSFAAGDQAPIPHIGAFVLPQSSRAFETGLREGLHDLGYIEGKSIIIDWRRAGAQENDTQRLAIELASSKLDVIVLYGTPAARAALQVNKTTPIVFGSGDPVKAGLVPNLTHPGGNATGISAVMTESTGKRLELLREIAPRARRIACLTNPEDPLGIEQLKRAQQAGPSVGMQVIELDARNDTQLGKVLGQLPRSGFDGILITADVLFEANNRQIAHAIQQARLPAVFPFRYNDYFDLLSY
jgi:putative ABC transport system substrate-binding protein